MNPETIHTALERNADTIIISVFAIADVFVSALIFKFVAHTQPPTIMYTVTTYNVRTLHGLILLKAVCLFLLAFAVAKRLS